jgi:hypothetical protein
MLVGFLLVFVLSQSNAASGTYGITTSGNALTMKFVTG